MFSLTIAVGNQAWRLLYKNQEDAEKRFEIVKDAVIGATQAVGFISDDFGQTFSGRPIGVLLEDLEKMKMATHLDRPVTGVGDGETNLRQPDIGLKSGVACGCANFSGDHRMGW